MNKLTALAIALIALTPVAASANEHEKAAAPAVAADAAAPAVAPAAEVKEVTLKHDESRYRRRKCFHRC